MGNKFYGPGQEDELGRDLMAFAGEVLVEFHRELHAAAGEFALRATPRDTGEMASRWGDRVNRQDMLPAGPRANLHRIRLGSSSGRINDDPGGGAIDFGRKRVFYPQGVKRKSGAKPFSRTGGSAQAPRGISQPTIEHVLARQEFLGRRAAATVEAKFGRITP